MKTFAAALLSLALLSAGSAEAATASKTKVLKAKPAAAQPRKVKSVVVRKVVATPAVATFGMAAGLHAVDDPLALKSSVAYVLDQNTNEVLFSKNPQAVLPIASITKLMTALVVVESGLSLDEKLVVTDEDKDTEKGTGSRLAFGTTLTRGEMLHLALMSSENRAAHALGRNYPGGLDAFVAAMNAKAASLGMTDTHYVEPTGLSSRNQSSAADLAKLVNTTSQVPLLRDLSTSREARVALGKRLVQFRSTNGLLSNPLVGHRPAKDRFHQRGREVPGHAGQHGRPQADHGVPRLQRQGLADCRCRARAQVDGCAPRASTATVSTKL